MEPHITGIEGFVGVWAAVFGIGSLIFSLIWLRIGWRAMRAHERLSDAMQSFSRNAESPRSTPPR
jgi:uncharacterized membrane protein YciS (DUF1049 family)